jgi:RNA-directed DNA polymerase
MLEPFDRYQDVAIWMGIRPKNMTFCAAKTEQHVDVFEITTNHGQKKRTIYAPKRLLKFIQRKIKAQVLDDFAVPDNVHGFVAGRGCATNAAGHGGGLVVNIDLKDFFPSITTERVFGMWRKTFKANTQVAWGLTHVTTFSGHLCQGFVTSPQIANIVAWKLDQRLSALAKKFDFVYTRYADDLTFTAKSWAGDCRWLIDATRDIVKDEDFTVNEKKVAIMRPHRRQVVTGLVVNRVPGVEENHPRIPKFHLKWLRAACDQWAIKKPEERAHITGWISYVQSVQPDKAAKLKETIAAREKEGSKKWDTRPSL